MLPMKPHTGGLMHTAMAGLSKHKYKEVTLGWLFAAKIREEIYVCKIRQVEGRT